MLRALAWAVMGALLAGCANPARVPSKPARAPTENDAVPMSVPKEYRWRPLSAEAGARTFSRDGIGDPYGAGIAYPVWLALLETYPDELGGTVAGFQRKFGFLNAPLPESDPDRAVPLGFHLTVDPNTQVSFVMMNCAACHAEVLRLPDGPRLVMGLGNKRVRMHDYDAALMRVASSPTFTTERLGKAARRAAHRHGATWPTGSRGAIVDASVRGFRERARLRGPDAIRLAQGALPGRVATIESFALALRTHGAEISIGATPGYAKVPDVVGFPYRKTFSYDGSGIGAPSTLAVEADFAFGVRAEWYETQRHIGTSLYLYLRSFSRQLKYPGPLDEALARRGQDTFDARCANCHGHYSGPSGERRISYAERVIPVQQVGTDRARLDAVSDQFVKAANALPLARGLAEVVPTGGYVPPVLLDVWARGVYGHAGQWPSVAFLALPEDERPQRFIVDAEAAYDLEGLGTRYRLAAPGADVGPGSYLQDATRPGYGTGGHPYLSDLDATSRRAVLEYLKTL